MTTMTTIANLLAMNPASSTEVYVLGYYTPGDLGGGEFYYDSSSSATPNSGTIFQSTYTSSGRWFRVLNGTRVNARWFGAYGNGSNNDTASLKNAVDYCGATGFGLYLPAGTYVVYAASSADYGLRIGYNGFLFEGDGYDSEIINGASTPCAAVVGVINNSGQIQDVTVRNIRINGNKANQSGSWAQKCITVVALNNNSTPLNVTLEGLYCHNAYSYNPSATEGGGISITGDDQLFSMTEFYPQNIIIKGCFCWDNGGWGIGTNWSNSVIISQNVCWNNDTQGITLWNAQDTVVDANRCYANGSIGINTEIVNRVTISNNSVNSTHFYCIRAYNSIDVAIVGNVCELNTSSYTDNGIGAESGNGYYSGGLYKRRPCQNLQISGNIVKCTGSDGMALKIINYSGYAENKAINVNDNTIVHLNTFKGVEIVATDLNFANNTVVGFASFSSGGGFLNIDSNDIRYDASVVSFNLVTINYGVNVMVKGNILRAAQNCNGIIALTQPYTNSIVFDNAYQGSYTYFIALYGSASMPTTRDNMAW